MPLPRMHALLEKLEDAEVAGYEKLLSRLRPLDPIEHKDVEWPDILTPQEDAPVEWWYFTGHLTSPEKEYGFELCFFKFHPQAMRLGPFPLSTVRKKPYLVLHTAVTDKTDGDFRFWQDTGLAHREHISSEGVQLSLQAAQLTLTDEGEWHLATPQFSLLLTPEKKPVKHFGDGYKTMHENSEHRTYYVSQTRLSATGTLYHEGEPVHVSGQAWFDHQKMNKPANTTMAGWDWYSVQFSDESELMHYTIRDEDGTISGEGGTYIDRYGKAYDLEEGDVRVEPTGTWTSPKTGITYLHGWTLTSPRFKINAEIRPCVEDQEVDAVKTALHSYWEGACEVAGKKRGREVVGKSYVELMGYDDRPLIQALKKNFG